MIDSEYDNRHVVYIDPLHIAHTGVVVGQSEDGIWLFVQSDNPNVPPANWHFKIAADKIDAFLQKPTPA